MANDKAFKVKNGLELGAYAAVITSTAVAVFVYDTSKDSDRGAWRKRTQHTSWYNETLNTATRGARREFPAVAVIVADATTLTIYDGDDPSLPMWMVFEVNATKAVWQTASSVTMLNGKLVIGHLSGYGVSRIDFLSETSVAYAAINYLTNKSLPLAQRNYGASFVALSDGQSIVNANVNDVAMTVLPDAPIDPATGLPVPTIAVATDGGLSVITDSGAVYDSLTTRPVLHVTANSDSVYFIGQGVGDNLFYAELLGITSDGFGSAMFDYNDKSTFPRRPTIAGSDLIVDGGPYATGFSRFITDGAANEFAEANIRSTYNTGWMPGDIKGAFLSDTDDTDLTDAGLVTNGTFNTDSDWTKGTGWAISGGVATHSGTTAGNLQQTVFEAGKTYKVEWTQGGSNFVSVYGDGLVTLLSNTSVDGSYSVYFNSLSGGALSFRSAADGATIDNVSVKLADADRSVNANGLIVHGTVTRTPVATGADLVAYSGFSASNYLEQPYNSDLDFGTGDFCVMGWVKGNDNGTILERTLDPGDGRTGIQIVISSSSFDFKVFDAGASVACSATKTSGFDFFTAVRDGDATYLYVNGLLADVSSGASSYNVSATNAVLSLGERVDLGTYPLSSGSLALLRISATAPTAEQIAKIYNDEKVLFQEGAQATLYGASDAVTALAHDPELNLLHVGTSAGRSVFQGLRRVSNTTTAVGTAISASNGLVVEE
jgi:hypothetical protein